MRLTLVTVALDTYWFGSCFYWLIMLMSKLILMLLMCLIAMILRWLILLDYYYYLLYWWLMMHYLVMMVVMMVVMAHWHWLHFFIVLVGCGVDEFEFSNSIARTSIWLSAAFWAEVFEVVAVIINYCNILDAMIVLLMVLSVMIVVCCCN